MGLRSTIDDNYYFIVLQTAAKCFLVFSELCPLLSILFLIVIFVDTSIFIASVFFSSLLSESFA